MKRLLGPVFDLRRSEWRLTALLSANYYFLLLFHYLLKPARDALFLVKLDPDSLPWAYLLTALFAVPVTALYSREASRRRLDRLVLWSLLALALSIVGLRLLLQLKHAWVFYLFYAWVGIAGGLTVSQFWLLANSVFDVSQAKRLFPVLGLGGIAGAFTGGEITHYLVNNLGLATADLLIISIAVLAVVAIITVMTFRKRPIGLEVPRATFVEDRVQNSTWEMIQSIARSKHLSLTVGILTLTVMTAAFIDFQFKTVAWQAYPDQTELTAFLGRFYGHVSLLALLVQAFLATRLIRLFGAGGVLLILPGVLGLGAIGLILLPGLAAGIALRGSDFVLKYSLDKTSRELLFLPIPLALKKRTKVFIDMFVDRWARGIAGGLLLLFTAVLHFELHQLAIVTVVMLVGWFVLALFVKREYVNSFRTALARREIDLADLRVRVDDATAIGALSEALTSGNRREVLYALDVLQDVSVSGLADVVRPLLDHESGSVRQRAVTVLANNIDPQDADRVQQMLSDPILQVRVEVVSYLVKLNSDQDQTLELLSTMLARDSACRNAAIAFIETNDSTDEYRNLINRLVVDVVQDKSTGDTEEGRTVLAGLSWTPAGCDDQLWDNLLADTQESVVEAAVEGIGNRFDLTRVDWLLERIDHPHLRLVVRRTLAVLMLENPEAIYFLAGYFQDRSNTLRARAEIPRILALVPLQNTVDLLLKHLATHEPELRYESLKSLGKLRSKYAHLKFDRQLVNGEITFEATRFSQLSLVVRYLPEVDIKVTLLAQAIAEMQALRLESVFRLLGLLYPARDLVNAYHGLQSGRSLTVANAREFLDNILQRPHRSLVHAVLDGSSPVELDDPLGVDFEPAVGNTQQALDFLGASCDPWLSATAIYAGSMAVNPAAAAYLEQKGDEVLIPIEKVLLLQSVELFAAIPSDQMAALAAIAREVSVLSEDVIFEEGDLPDAFYLVLEGQINLFHDKVLVSEAGRHDSFGTWALFDEQSRVMTAVASENTRLLRIDRSEFNDLLADDVRIAKGIIRTVTGRLRDLADKLAGNE